MNAFILSDGRLLQVTRFSGSWFFPLLLRPWWWWLCVSGPGDALFSQVLTNNCCSGPCPCQLCAFHRNNCRLLGGLLSVWVYVLLYAPVHTSGCSNFASVTVCGWRILVTWWGAWGKQHRLSTLLGTGCDIGDWYTTTTTNTVGRVVASTTVTPPLRQIQLDGLWHLRL